MKKINLFDEEYFRCKKIWKKQGLTWIKRFENEFNLHRFVKENLVAYSSVLDIGCCDGIFAYNITRYGMNVTALDASDEAIKKAEKQRTKFTGLDKNPIFLHKRFEDFNSDSKFDYVVMLEFLEHIDSIDAASFLLRKAYNLTSKSLIVSVPIDHLLPDDDHKIVFSAEKFFELISKSTFQQNEPTPIIQYHMIHKLYQNQHNKSFTPNIFVAVITKLWN